MVNVISLLVEPFNSRKSLLFISDFISVFFCFYQNYSGVDLPAYDTVRNPH